MRETGCEDAKIADMHVAAGHRLKPRARRMRQIPSHDGGGTAQEAEGRFGHPGQAERHQTGDPRRILGRDDGNGIRAIGIGPELGVAAARHVLPQGFPWANRSARVGRGRRNLSSPRPDGSVPIIRR
ncbi:hypothetical protein GCM10008966_30560 [Rhodovulum strictum]|nr:hypothetical protein [Rhodovulum strictum]